MKPRNLTTGVQPLTSSAPHLPRAFSGPLRSLRSVQCGAGGGLFTKQRADPWAPCISMLGSPRPLGQVGGCWVPPEWGRSSCRRNDVVWGRERLGQGRSVLRRPHSDPRGQGEAVPRKGLKLQPEHRKEHAPRGGTHPGLQLQAAPRAPRRRRNKPGGGGLPARATRTHRCGAGACRGPDWGGMSSGWRWLPPRAGI